MEFIGTIGFDGGDDAMESRTTNPASFAVISDWFRSVIEFHGAELKYNPACIWNEITVSVYVDDETVWTPDAVAIEHVILRKPYRN